MCVLQVMRRSLPIALALLLGMQRLAYRAGR